MNSKSLLLVLMLAIFGTVNAAAQVTQNVAGTQGEVIVNGYQPFYRSGVVLRAKPGYPFLALQTGTSDPYSAFLIVNSSEAELMRVRSDGVITLSGVEGSWWNAALSPSIEHKNSSVNFGDNTEMMLSSNAFYDLSGRWIYRTNQAAANYYQASGQHHWRVAPYPATFTAASTVVPWKYAMSIIENGNVGIGTLYPQASLHVHGATPLRVDAVNGTGFGIVFRDLLAAEGIGSGVLMDMQGNSKIKVSNMVIGGTAMPTINSVGAALQLNSTGGQDVIIGAQGSGTDLVVHGNVTGARVYNAVYQDVAEWVSSDESLTDGTVVVVAGDKDDHVVTSTQSYDARVAGVVSPNPGVLLGIAGDGKYKIATTGRVKVKVDASTHAIARGDLLVTSNKAGVAMKSVPVDLGGAQLHRPGTLIGKALEPLASGEGEILVLLSLQ